MDTSHWAAKGIDPLTVYRAGGQRITHLHLSNFDARRQKQHRLPHRGDLDLAGLLQAMAADQFSGTITIELYPDALDFSDGEALRSNMRDSLAFCREHLAINQVVVQT